MRICSLLPGATEIACALGLADEIVGVSHECDFPAAARSKPVMVRSRIDPTKIGSGEIDRQVGDLLRSKQSLYALDEKLFKERGQLAAHGNGAVRNVQSLNRYAPSIIRPLNPIHVVQRSTVQSFNERANFHVSRIPERRNELKYGFCSVVWSRVNQLCLLE